MDPARGPRREVLGRGASADFGEKRYVGNLASTDGYRRFPRSRQYPVWSPSCPPIMPLSSARLFPILSSLTSTCPISRSNASKVVYMQDKRQFRRMKCDQRGTRNCALKVLRARGVMEDGRTETGGENVGGKCARGTCQRDRQPRLQ